MKRLLFAGIIFFNAPLTAQIKAGKMDTVRTAVYYASTKPSATLVLNLSAKEQAAHKTSRSNSGVIVKPSKQNRNLSAKEQMKSAVTGSN